MLRLQQKTSSTSKQSKSNPAVNFKKKSQNEESEDSTTRESLPKDIFSETEDATFNSQTSANVTNSNFAVEADFQNSPNFSEAESVVVPGTKSVVQVQTGIPGLDEYTQESESEEEYSLYDAAAAAGVTTLDGILPGSDSTPFNVTNFNIPPNYYNYLKFGEVFSPTSISNILTKSLSLKPDLEIKILSHEILKINNSSGLDSNLLFMSKNDLSQNKFESIRNSEINKCESINDRLIQYIDVSKHSELVNISIEKSKVIISSLDKITSFSNKLEKQINYGNIVEDFIINNSSDYNGKILNTITENSNISLQSFYIGETGGSDERLLDKQSKTEISELTVSDLEIFYKNISGFDFRERKEDAPFSILNNIIINSDSLIGQMFINQSIGMYSLYPNTDNIHLSDVLEKRNRINTNALNRFPIVQVANLSLNSRIFSTSNFEILNIKGSSFNKSNIPYQSFDPYNVYLRNFNSYDFMIKNVSVDKDDDNYYRRISVAGKNPASDRFTIAGRSLPFDNNVFKINLKSADNTKYTYETLYADVNTNFNIKSPSFYIYPERFFMSDLIKFDNQNSSENEFMSSQLPNQIIASSNSDSDVVVIIKDRIRSLFFNNFTGSNLSSNEDAQRLIQEYVLKLGSFYTNYIENRLITNYLYLFKNSYKALGIESSEAEYNLNIVNNSIEDFTTLERITDIEIGSHDNDSFEAEGSIFTNTVQRVSESFTAESGERFEANQLTSRLIDFLNNATGQVEQEYNRLDIQDLKSDFFVFECSNSFLNKRELETFSFEGDSVSNIIPIDARSKGSLSYIKTNVEKLLNYNDKDSNSKASDFIYKNIGTISSIKYSKFSLLIANSVNIVKRKLGKSHSKVFDDFLKKCKSKLKQSNEFTLLYDKFEETSFDTFENSKFIDNNSYKNNFVKEFSNIRNTSKSYFSNEIISNNHLFTSEKYREFLSKIYTKSFLRDNVTLFKRIIKDSIDIFTSSNTYESNEYFGFDVLLATALSNINNNDTNNIKKIIKLVLSNAIIKSAGLENQIKGLEVKQSNLNMTFQSPLNYSNFIFYEKLEKIYGKDFIEEVVKSIYDQKNIHKQKNYVLRELNTFNNNIEFLDSMTASNGTGGVRFNSINGNIHTLLFPLKYTNHGKPENVEWKKSMLELSNSKEGLPSVLEVGMGVKKLASNLAYNYDVFIDKEKTGICFYENNEDDQILGAGYNFSKENKIKSSDLKISYFNYKKPQQGIDKLTSPPSIVGEPTPVPKWTINYGNVRSDDNKPIMPYDNKEVIIPFCYNYLSGRDNTYSNKITKICQDILEIFEVNYTDINNIDDVLNFIDQNEFYLKLLQDIFEAFSSLFIDSYENFLTILIDKIRSGVYTEDSISFVSGNSSVLKEKAVSDLYKISTKINSNKKRFLEGNLIYTVDNFIEQRGENEIYSKRSQEIQNVFKILNNSDLATALCHDIIHGYFLNYEDNVQLRNNDLTQFEENINFILSNINDINNFNIDKKDLISLLQNEFYQNILSRDLQEIMYYKNMFNETFIKNNMFNTIKEKYESINLFNTKKLFYRNNINQALQGLNKLSELSSKSDVEKIDVIRIPISYDIVKKIGERGILQIDILPVNLKYPEIEYSKLTFYFCPALTSVTSNYGLSISNLFNEFVGFYDDTQKISKRYSIVSKETANFEISKIVEEVLIRRAEQSIETQTLSLEFSNRIVSDAIMSNAIKSINFISQKNLDENIKNIDFDITNLIHYDTTNLISYLDVNSLKKIFSSYKKNTNEFTNLDSSLYSNLDSNNNIISNNDFYKKFILNVDENTSCSSILKSLVPNVYYDVFNIAINRNIIPKEDEENVVDIRNSRINNDLQANKSFNYYISTKVI